MSDQTNIKQIGKEAILADVVKIIQETCGWNMEFNGAIGLETFLGADIALQSLDFVRLVYAVQEHYSFKQPIFQEIFTVNDDAVFQDIKVSQIVDFIYNQLNINA